MDQKGPFWVFLDWNLKKIISYFKSAPLNLSSYDISRENKNGKILDQKCLICVFLGWNLKTILSYLKSAPWSLSNCKILWNNKKDFEKKYCHIWNQHPRICLLAKFCEKMKFPNFFCLKWLVWVFLGSNLKKKIVIFKIRTLEFV